MKDRRYDSSDDLVRDLANRLDSIKCVVVADRDVDISTTIGDLRNVSCAIFFDSLWFVDAQTFQKWEATGVFNQIRLRPLRVRGDDFGKIVFAIRDGIV